MEEAFGHHAVERRGDAKVRFEFLFGVHTCLRGAAGLFAGLHQRLCGIHHLFGLDDFGARDHAGRGGRLLQVFQRALGGGELRLGLGAVGFGGVHAGAGFHDSGLDLGRAEFGEHLPLLHDAAAVHGDGFDVPADAGMNRHAQVGQKLAGQVDGAGDRLRDHRDKVGGAPRGRNQRQRQEQEFTSHRNTGFPGREDSGTVRKWTRSAA